MKRRRHRANIHIDEGQVRKKALQLPKNGVPPEVLRVMRNDDGLDKLKPQKAATPVPGRVSVSEAFANMRPNMVVSERSGKQIVTQMQLVFLRSGTLPRVCRARTTTRSVGSIACK